MGQKWSIDADGGHLANPDLSREIRHAAQPMMKFAQFVRREPGFGKNMDETINFDKISDVVVAASTTGLVETNSMPETKVIIRKGALTVTEYGNSVPHTGKLEALAEFDPQNITQRALRNDQAKTLDARIAAYFKKSEIYYRPTGTVGTPTSDLSAGTAFTGGEDASRNLQMFDVEVIVDYLKSTLLCEPYDDEGNYICIANVTALRGIKNDDKFIQAARYGDPERLFAGEVGRIEGVRFIETNHAAAMTDHGTASVCGEALFFGEDPVVEGVAIAPEIRAKIPTDYGRSKGVAWYALMGWECPWQFNTDAEARIVWVTSNLNTNQAAA